MKHLLTVLMMMLILSLAVLGTGVAPVAVNDSYTGTEDTTLVIATAQGVLDGAGADTDAENDDLTAVVVANPQRGSVILNSDGSFTYTPQANFNGTDSFTYNAYDGTSNSASPATVIITVNAVNDVPVISNSNPASPVSINEGASQVFSVTATDVESATLSYTWVLDGATVAASGTSFTYAAPQVDANTNHTLTVRVSDGQGGEAIPTTWAITVANVVVPSGTPEEQRYDALQEDFDHFDDDYDDFRREYLDAIDDRDDSEERRYENKLEDLEEDVNDLQDDIDDLQDDVNDLSPRNRPLEDDVDGLQEDAEQLLDDIRDVLDKDGDGSDGTLASGYDGYSDSYFDASATSQAQQTASAYPPAGVSSTTGSTTGKRVVYQPLQLPADSLIPPPPQAQPSAAPTSLLLGLLVGGIVLIVAAITFMLLMLRR